MKKFLNRIFVFISLVVFTGLTAFNALAGGLVDTNADRFAASDFDTNPSEDITNPWWTLSPGNSLYFAESEDECVWNLVEVLALTTDNFEGIYAGTEARIVLDREWVDEDCVHDNFQDVYNDVDIETEEVTYDWYAQDFELNIWYMGEDTWDGESNEGSFIAGCDSAEAGIVILGGPFKGAFYQQELYEEEAEDWGKVLNFIPDDDLTCMKTKEWTPLEPGSVEHKFYCSDGEVGELSMIEELKGKTVIVELIDTNISPTPAMPAAPPSPIPNCLD